jgi:hypothetical protein
MKILIKLKQTVLSSDASLSSVAVTLKDDKWYLGKLIQDYDGKPAGATIAFQISHLVHDIRYILFDTKSWWNYLHTKTDPVDKIVKPVVIDGEVAEIHQPRSGILSALLSKLTANSPKLFKRR